MERMEKIYADEDDIPQEFLNILAAQKKRLIDAKEKHGADNIPPDSFI